MDHLTIFDELYPKFKITKPVRLIEFFAGYGSQALALKYLGVKFEHWKICEWAVKSIQAYKDIHFENDNTDYSIVGPFGLEIEWIKNYLFRKGISSNYNEPMTRQQIDRLNEQQVKTIFNNIKATHNLVNIQQVKGKDLEIVDKDKYDYILTYSFPCQDLSLAGKGKGMSDTSTRSGMLWEVERILKELKETDSLPQVLLMENVPQVHSTDNTPDFNKWQLELTKLGYKNYWEDLIATDYGIPQTRNRCFMVSILGDYNYSFPKPIPLKKKLKDMLEDNVDEKYYLSDKMIDFYIFNTEKQKENGNGFKFEPITKDEAKISKTITTRSGSRMDDNFITNKPLRETLEKYENKIVKSNQFIDSYNRTIRNDDLSCTISTRVDASNNNYLLVKNATKKGYLEATDGDEIDISSRMEHHRGTVQKEKAQTLTTQCDGGVVVKPKVIGGIGEKDSNNNTQWKQQNRIYDENVAISVTTSFNPYYKDNLRIRKLTPKECFRLMGVKDEDFEKVKVNQSDSSLYHLAGDSIVVNVLMAIFKEMI